MYYLMTSRVGVISLFVLFRRRMTYDLRFVISGAASVLGRGAWIINSLASDQPHVLTLAAPVDFCKVRDSLDARGRMYLCFDVNRECEFSWVY